MGVSSVNSSGSVNNLYYYDIGVPSFSENEKLLEVRTSPGQSQPKSLIGRINDYNRLTGKIRKSNQRVEDIRKIKNEGVACDIVGMSVLSVVLIAALTASVAWFVFAVISVVQLVPMAGLLVMGSTVGGTTTFAFTTAAFVSMYGRARLLYKATAPNGLENAISKNKDLKQQQIEFLKFGDPQSFLAELEQYNESEFDQAGFENPSKTQIVDPGKHNSAVRLKKHIDALKQLIIE